MRLVTAARCAARLIVCLAGIVGALPWAYAQELPPAAPKPLTLPAPETAAYLRAIDVQDALGYAPVHRDAPASDVLRVAEEPDSPWGFEAGLALSLSQGNSEILDLRADLLATYERGPWHLEAGAIFVYGETDGSQSAENLHLHGKVRRDLSPRFYVFGQVLYDRDVFADLQHRITPTVGVGVVLGKTQRAELTAEAGVGYTFEKRFSAGSWTRDPSGYLGLDYAYEHPSGRALNLTWDFLPNFGDFDLSQMIFEARLDQPIGDVFNLSAGLRITHVLDPPSAGVDSTDVLLTLGIRAKW